MAAQPPRPSSQYLWLAGAMAVIAVLRLAFANGSGFDIAVGVLALVVMGFALWRYRQSKRTVR